MARFRFWDVPDGSDLEIDALKSRIAELKAEIEPLREMIRIRDREIYNLEQEFCRRRSRDRRAAKKALEIGRLQ
ncbi:MAG TPA: hypothetical protein VK714_14825 [Myxococcota bacterium]|nr:hypothetical protein [Myxococcota bacterium]